MGAQGREILTTRRLRLSLPHITTGHEGQP